MSKTSKTSKKPLKKMKMPKVLKDGDYILGEGSGWFEVGGFAIRLSKTDEGVAVDIYDTKELNKGNVDSIHTAYAFDNELSE